MKDCTKDLSHDGSTDGGKKPAEKAEAKQPDAMTEERNRRREEHEKECDEQNLIGRLPQRHPNKKGEPSPHRNEPANILRRSNTAHPKPSKVWRQIHDAAKGLTRKR